jgi:predicted RNase H-like HicB family nuclease
MVAILIAVWVCLEPSRIGRLDEISRHFLWLFKVKQPAFLTDIYMAIPFFRHFMESNSEPKRYHRLTVVITQEDEWYVARCLEIEVVSQGHSVEEALKNIKEAIGLYIESFGCEDLPLVEEPPLVTSVEIAFA